MSTLALLMALLVLGGFGALIWMLVMGRVGSGFAFPLGLIASACLGLMIVSNIFTNKPPNRSMTATFGFMMIMQILSAVQFAKKNDMLKR
jgi:hypothetical protein